MLPHFSVFTHLSTEKAASYRSVLAHFAEARSQFVLHLRPAEISQKLGLSEETLAPLLEQLATWGNVERSRDHVDATSVEEFYHVKWLYQLSARGEAAEQALEAFESAIHQPGELQTEALRDIIDYLRSLKLLLEENASPAQADFSKILRQFVALNNRFEEFTVQAQRFMQFLQNTIELHGLTLEDFIDYKEKLIDYLQRFVGELITSTNEIEQGITALERLDVRHYFPGLARQARIDSLDPGDAEKLAAEESQRLGRWEGLRLWFLGRADAPSQAETLRARAREAIPALLLALQSFHDQRETGSDRRRDWMQLASWMAEAPDDESAHRLWRVAFAMAPCRHLRINEETLALRDQAGETRRTSWLTADPMWLEPQIRNSSRAPRSASTRPLVDRSKEREALRAITAEETAQIARAHDRLVQEVPMRLSDFETLDPFAFDLLLDLLGRAVSESAGFSKDDYPIESPSSDGSLVVSLWLTDDDTEARISTSAGVLTSPDFFIKISSAY